MFSKRSRSKPCLHADFELNADLADPNVYASGVVPFLPVCPEPPSPTQPINKKDTFRGKKKSGTSAQIGLQIVHFPQDLQSKEGCAIGFYTKPAVHESLVLQALRDST
jgi:hypothetical protein